MAWHTLLRGVVGSTAYGLATEESDVDYLEVAAAPTLALCGLKPLKESIVTHDPDYTIHEAAKFARLALACNPTITELMWLDKYETMHPTLGMQLIGIRRRFLSAGKVRSAYLGYATQQFHRLRDRGDGSFSADTRKRTAKHARHLARLCDQGYGLYATGKLRIKLGNPTFYRNFGEQVASGNIEIAETLMRTTEANFEETRSVLPEEPDVDAVTDWLLSVRREYINEGE